MVAMRLTLSTSMFLVSSLALWACRELPSEAAPTTPAAPSRPDAAAPPPPTTTLAAGKRLYVFALYHAEADTEALVKRAKALAAAGIQPFTVVDQFEADTARPALIVEQRAGFEAPPANYLGQFGHGLTPGQIQATAQAPGALVLSFLTGADADHGALMAAQSLTHRLAVEAKAVIMDESTREAFSPKAWTDRRLTPLADGLPDLGRHIVVRVIQPERPGDRWRLLSMGLQKFGLPDLVIEHAAPGETARLGVLVSLAAQRMAEGLTLKPGGLMPLSVKQIRHPAARARLGRATQGAALTRGQTLDLETRLGQRREGDPDNRLMALTFPGAPDEPPFARQRAALDLLLGQGAVAIKGDPTLDARIAAASEAARAALSTLLKQHPDRLPAGFMLHIKGPFPTPDGGREWMWVRAERWSAEAVHGRLDSSPRRSTEVKAGDAVQVRRDEIFDYLLTRPDGGREGNTTGPLLAARVDTGGGASQSKPAGKTRGSEGE